MPIYHLIQTLDRWLAGAERGLVIALTITMTGIMVTQVVLRYFFNAPLFWAEEISVQLLVFITLFGLSLLTRAGALVTIDFLPQALSPRGRHVLAIGLGIGFLILLGFITKLGWEWIIRPDVQAELGATTQLPRWYNYSLLPAALLAMSFHQFTALLRHLHDLKQAHA
ncbi:MAG TPA: TRAP transporter small permease [Candidatus Competibacteraceae bacterium]|nr:TRAP transporter small permease [Candidatus Competibacteraceae bacterium]